MVRVTAWYSVGCTVTERIRDANGGSHVQVRCLNIHLLDHTCAVYTACMVYMMVYRMCKVVGSGPLW